MEEHSYIYAGGKLLRETVSIVDEQGSEIERTLDFRYDSAGLPYALHYKDDFEGIEQTYYYITNLQGDVMYMVDESGDEVASYEYDPYGKLLRTTGDMAETNPLRYRGYYYDNETSFYYLQSRYYDAAICRFINFDNYTATGQGLIGYNMFAYCNNNPINCADPTGTIAITPNKRVAMADTGAVSGSAAAGGLIALGILWLLDCWTKTDTPTKPTTVSKESTVEEDLTEIASKYGNLECKDAQNEMKKYCIKNKVDATAIKIEFKGDKHGFIYSETYSRVISLNGCHYGVEVNGIIYCNVHPYGLPVASWLADFLCLGQMYITRTPITWG